MPRWRATNKQAAERPAIISLPATTMTKLVFTAACFLLLLLLANNAVECRRHPHRRVKDRMLFVFGDSFVDAGNRPPSQTGPQWSYPYGSSDSGHNRNATGRFSDGLVQSDFLARIVLQGRDGDESPPPYRLRKANEVDPTGVNFAIAGAGALLGSSQDEDPLSLSTQMDQFRRLVNHGIIDERDLDDSVALIAFSGLWDYQTATVADNYDDMCGKVTDALADAVRRLQDLGVSKVMVNALPPVGCQPFRTFNYKYAHCDSLVSRLTDTHNAALRRKLDGVQDVLVLDIHAAFSDVIQARYAPCCAGDDADVYCGQKDHDGKPLYKLCPDPENYFYWDYIHPTQAAWESVMDYLQPAIQDFLATSN